TNSQQTIPFPCFIHVAKVILLWLLLQFNAQMLANNPLGPEVEDRIMDGIEFTILNKFDEAEKIYRELTTQYPEEPMGYFYLAAVIQSEMLDREDYSRQAEFEGMIKTCIDKSVNLQKKRKGDPYLLFYEASAYLYRSFMQSKQGKWWPAYRSASRGANRLTKVLKADSSFYDAFLGIGSFKYWKSSKTKFVRWIPFIPDEREKGIRMVKKAVEKGAYVRFIARDQLAWILLDAGRTGEALQCARENYRLYPQSRFFRWTLVNIYDKAGDMENAYNLYQKLLVELRAMPENNHYNEIGCLLRMAEIDFARGNIAGANTLATEIMSLKLDSNIRKRARNKLKKALKLKKECEKALSHAVPQTGKTVLQNDDG
ncbi:MAG: tetratricopeptide repeat protein, partial [Calditrichia bacterium]